MIGRVEIAVRDLAAAQDFYGGLLGFADERVEFTIEPQDPTGDVRLAFFRDPDGTLLELLSGPPRYHRTFSPELAERERAALPGPGDPPRLAHLAITVARPPGERLIGELYLEEEDMAITFVDGPVPLELFSFPDGELLPKADGNLRAVKTAPLQVQARLG